MSPNNDLHGRHSKVEMVVITEGPDVQTGRELEPDCVTLIFCFLHLPARILYVVCGLGLTSRLAKSP